MQYLANLVQFLDQRNQLIKIVDAAVEKQTNVRRLLHYLKETEEATETGASLAVFGTEKDSRLPKTKTQLKNHIINGILIKGVGKMRPTTESYRLYVAGYMLWRNGSSELAIPLLEKAYRKALTSEETAIVVAVSEKLTNYFGIIQTDLKKWQTYRKARDEHTQILAAHRIIYNLYTDLNRDAQLPAPEVDRRYVQEQLRRYDVLTERRSVPILDQYLRLSTGLESLNLNQELTADYLNEQLSDQVEKLERSPNAHRQFLLQLSLTLLANRDFDSTLKVMDQLEALSRQRQAPVGRFNNKYLIGVTYAYMENFSAATQYIDQAIEWSKTSKIPEINLEQLRILQMLLALVVPSNHHDQLVEHWHLRLPKFLNQLTAGLRDKIGDNVLVYVIEILWQVHYRKYGKADERIDALNRYVVRHKLRQYNPRYYYFTRLLAALSVGNYHPVATRRKAANAFVRFQAYPLRRLDLKRPEPVPLDTVWQATLAKLR